MYVSMTYIHNTHTTAKGWYDESGKCLKTPIGKGRRLIIVHAGEEMGFVPNALLMFPSGNYFFW